MPNIWAPQRPFLIIIIIGPSPWKILAANNEKDISEQPSPWRKSSKRKSCYGDRVYMHLQSITYYMFQPWPYIHILHTSYILHITCIFNLLQGLGETLVSKVVCPHNKTTFFLKCSFSPRRNAICQHQICQKSGHQSDPFSSLHITTLAH